MSRIGILNILIGFSCVLLAASGGTFLSLEITQIFLNDPEWLHSWNIVLLKSAHNHFNQFGYLMILFGLTTPYSRLPQSFLLWQSLGLWLGALAMGPGMIWKAAQGPRAESGVVDYLLGLFIALALSALFLHVAGLLRKFMRA